MFNIHTSMITANEENVKLNARIVELNRRNESLELMVMNVYALKEEIVYLKTS